MNKRWWYIGGVLILVVIVWLGMNASQPAVTPTITSTPASSVNQFVACTDLFAPVCGVDGKTYSNRCVAEQQHGVKVAADGDCPGTSYGRP